MAKRPIKDKDWGRIYAFIWKKQNEPKVASEPDYKELFEKNPKEAIIEINKALQNAGYDPIDYEEGQLFDIGDSPADFKNTDLLDKIIKGEIVAFLQVRLTC